MSEKSNTKKVQKVITRRHFVKNTGIFVGGTIIGGVVGGSLFGKDMQTLSPINESPPSVPEHTPAPNYNQALMYFTREQFSIVEATTERIFPEDEHGPGAKLLGVAFFIDHQLAGFWGLCARDYTMGPFFPGEPTQGYQGQLNRQQVFDVGVKGLKDYSFSTYQKDFLELTAEEQDAVLTDFQNDAVTLRGLSSSYFFNLLRTSTLEGVYSDPLYGGNADMNGWKMKNYPGDQATYAHIMEQDEFVVLEPRSLKDHIKGGH